MFIEGDQGCAYWYNSTLKGTQVTLDWSSWKWQLLMILHVSGLC